MAYFDSSKNRALWEIRLKELRAERAAREAGEEKIPTRMERGPAPSPVRIPVTYKELLAEELQAVQNRRPAAAAMEQAKTRTKESAPQKKREASL